MWQDAPACAEKYVSLLSLMMLQSNTHLDELLPFAQDLAQQTLQEEESLHLIAKQLLSELNKSNFEVASELLQRLKNNIRSFDLELLRDVISRSRSEFALAKDVVMFLGPTGSGKSTVIHYICGSTLQRAHVDPKNFMPSSEDALLHWKVSEISNKFPGLENITCSPLPVSETQHVSQVRVQIDDLKISCAIEEAEVSLYDTPGFGDTRGVEKEISSLKAVVEALSCAASARIVILIPLQSNIEALDKLANDLESICGGDFSAIADSCGFLLVKSAPHDEEEHKAYFLEVLKNLVQTRSCKKSLLKLANFILKASQNGRCHCFGLFEQSEAREDLIRFIFESCSKITSPKDMFALQVSHSSRLALKNQTIRDEKLLKKASKAGDCRLMAWLLRRFRFLSELFPIEYSSTLEINKTFVVKAIVDSFDKCIKYVTHFLEELWLSTDFDVSIVKSTKRILQEAESILKQEYFNEVLEFPSEIMLRQRIQQLVEMNLSNLTKDSFEINKITLFLNQLKPLVEDVIIESNFLKRQTSIITNLLQNKESLLKEISSNLKAKQFDEFLKTVSELTSLHQTLESSNIFEDIRRVVSEFVQEQIQEDDKNNPLNQISVFFHFYETLLRTRANLDFLDWELIDSSRNLLGQEFGTWLCKKSHKLLNIYDLNALRYIESSSTFFQQIEAIRSKSSTVRDISSIQYSEIANSHLTTLGLLKSKLISFLDCNDLADYSSNLKLLDRTLEIFRKNTLADKYSEEFLNELFEMRELIYLKLDNHLSDLEKQLKSVTPLLSRFEAKIDQFIVLHQKTQIMCSFFQNEQEISMRTEALHLEMRYEIDKVHNSILENIEKINFKQSKHSKVQFDTNLDLLENTLQIADTYKFISKLQHYGIFSSQIAPELSNHLVRKLKCYGEEFLEAFDELVDSLQNCDNPTILIPKIVNRISDYLERLQTCTVDYEYLISISFSKNVIRTLNQKLSTFVQNLDSKMSDLLWNGDFSSVKELLQICKYYTPLDAFLKTYKFLDLYKEYSNFLYQARVSEINKILELLKFGFFTDVKERLNTLNLTKSGLGDIKFSIQMMIRSLMEEISDDLRYLSLESLRAEMNFNSIDRVRIMLSKSNKVFCCTQSLSNHIAEDILQESNQLLQKVEHDLNEVVEKLLRTSRTLARLECILCSGDKVIQDKFKTICHRTLLKQEIRSQISQAVIPGESEVSEFFEKLGIPYNCQISSIDNLTRVGPTALDLLLYKHSRLSPIEVLQQIETLSVLDKDFSELENILLQEHLVLLDNLYNSNPQPIHQHLWESKVSTLRKFLPPSLHVGTPSRVPTLVPVPHRPYPPWLMVCALCALFALLIVLR